MLLMVGQIVPKKQARTDLLVFMRTSSPLPPILAVASPLILIFTQDPNRFDLSPSSIHHCLVRSSTLKVPFYKVLYIGMTLALRSSSPITVSTRTSRTTGPKAIPR